ncbi:MAG: hypothetical protein HFF53_07040 [Lawsonibacter sp.]|nr:hypothetical protein [Lawsonibacter sp.]
MGGSKEFFAQKLDELPEFEGAYQEHLTYYEELLGHVFFGEETLLGALERLLPANEDRARIRQYIDFVEDMYANGDDDVQNIVGVTILECLGDDETVLRNAFSYFSEELMRASQSIEKGWGRRDIRIWHKNGKVLYDWSWPPNQAAQKGD